MSDIKKSERSESKLQTVHNAYKIRTAVTKLAENNFYFDLNKINEVVDQNTKNITDENGKIKELKFKTSRELRENAYLKLEVMLLTGVHSWEEVQYNELPDKVKANYKE